MKKIISIFAVCSIIMICCAQSPAITNTLKYSLLYKIKLAYLPQKACCNSLNNITYVWEKDTQDIHIYRLDTHINTIGGSGLDAMSFGILADICVFPDGDLLALDNLARSIKKFNVEGELVYEMKLAGDLDPALITVSLKQNIYIYDRSRQEIIMLDDAGKEKAAFGAMMLEDIRSLESMGDVLAVYDATNNITQFFSSYGAPLEHLPGRCIQYKGQFACLQQNFLQVQSSAEQLAVDHLEYLGMYYQAPELILYNNNYIKIGLIGYEKTKTK